MRVVINSTFGGFGLSHKAIMRYAELKGIKLYPFHNDITKKVYGDRAVIDNPDPEVAFWMQYLTKPVTGNKDKDIKNYWSCRDIPRTDTDLIKVIEEMGDEANGRCAQLRIIEIPDDIEWQIEEYDGNEWVAEKHRRWD